MIEYRVYRGLLEVAGHNNDLKVTVIQILKGVAITGTAVFLGGLFLGPLGLAAGGAIGGAIAYAAARPYKHIQQVLKEMDEKKRKVLAEAAISEAKSIGIDLSSIAIDSLDTAVSRKILVKALKCCGYKVA